MQYIQNDRHVYYVDLCIKRVECIFVYFLFDLREYYHNYALLFILCCVTIYPRMGNVMRYTDSHTFKAADLQNVLKSLVTNISKYLFKYI